MFKKFLKLLKNIKTLYKNRKIQNKVDDKIE